MFTKPFPRLIAVSGRAAFCLLVISGLVALRAHTAKSPVQARLPLAIHPANPTLNPRAISPTQSGSSQELQGLVIAIRPSGFSPAEVEITDGRYVLVVQNRSGLRDLTFQFDRQGGERLHQVRAQRSKWSKQFDLHPGTYVLSVADHPEWQCLLKVKPR